MKRTALLLLVFSLTVPVFPKTTAPRMTRTQMKELNKQRRLTAYQDKIVQLYRTLRNMKAQLVPDIAHAQEIQKAIDRINAEIDLYEQKIKDLQQ